MKKQKPLDRRVQRTHRALGEAILGLLHEKPYDDISVQDVLERADVGRSTFYLHFRDKDSLLAAQLERLEEGLFEAQRAAAPSQRSAAERSIAFSTFLFEHVHENRGLFRGLGRHGGEIVRRGIQRMVRRVLTESDGRRRAPDEVPASLLADFVATTFMMLVEHWMAQTRPDSPQRMDANFRALVVPSLRANR